MKKTVTTILSLALALILVSSLSSGVILAKDDDDHDNRRKNKNKYETFYDVVILGCSFEGAVAAVDSKHICAMFEQGTRDSLSDAAARVQYQRF